LVHIIIIIIIIIIIVFVVVSGLGASNIDLNNIKKSVGTAVQSFLVSFIPPMLHTHISFMYHCATSTLQSMAPLNNTILSRKKKEY
jgi:hypothetical protein